MTGNMFQIQKKRKTFKAQGAFDSPITIAIIVVAALIAAVAIYSFASHSGHIAAQGVIYGANYNTKSGNVINVALNQKLANTTEVNVIIGSHTFIGTAVSGPDMVGDMYEYSITTLKSPTPGSNITSLTDTSNGALQTFVTESSSGIPVYAGSYPFAISNP